MNKTLACLLLLLAACKDGKPADDSGIPQDSPPDDSSVDDSSVDDSSTPEDADNDGYTADDDCDDDNAAIHPGAAELCDGVDNDCDGTVDIGATDMGSWYADGDQDGYGSGEPTLACDPPEGTSSRGDDCDDADGAIHPDAEESDCADPVDYNCDGSVGYADGDGDGSPACQDCDDAEARAYPGATEVCDGIDNSCDGNIDEGVTTTYWQDADNDGYGDPGAALSACEQPSGSSTNAEDCDDTNTNVSPSATELCDGVDNDCDSTIDEDDSADASTWFADADSDGFGDAAVSTASCAAPSGFVSDDTDCDDSDSLAFPGAAPLDDATQCMRDHDLDDYGDSSASGGPVAGTDCDDSDGTVYPGADEDGGLGTSAGDGQDNDCDGYSDEGMIYGSGGDGAAAITADTDWSSIGGACTAVSALANRSVTVADSSALSVGDKVMLVNLQGSSSSSAALGAWELLDVSVVNGTTVRFVDPIAGTYGVGGNSDLTGQVVALFRVPQLSSLSVASGATLRGPVYDGSCGGVMPILVTGATTVDGAISMDAAGYSGGAQNTSYNHTGEQGASYTGVGSSSYLAHLGGGGGGGLSGASCTNCEGNGGGGGHGGAGTDGQQSNPSLGYGGVGGATYGDAQLLAMTLGSGGGAGANDQSVEVGIGGAGGAGGGAVLLRSLALTINGTVSANGEDGEIGCALNSNWCGTAAANQSEAEAGGGGAGGAVYLMSGNLSAVNDSVLATGGLGQLSGSSWARYSGDGGDGRVRVDATLINGLSAADGASEADAVCEPDPGSFQAP